MYIYVVAESEFGPCKIGFAERTQHRLGCLQCGNHRKLTLAFEMECPNYRMAEKIAHRRVLRKQLRGEWFDITVVEAINAVKQATYLAEQALARKRAREAA